MEVYPAIDLMDGVAVRLQSGVPSTVKRYDHLGSPVKIALSWEMYGATLLHIIDLDGALGQGNNFDIIREIAAQVSIPIQVGGGLRRESIIKQVFDMGVQRVIIGSLALENQRLIKELGNEYGFDKIVISLDYKNGQLVSRGWQQTELVKPQCILDSYRRMGAKHFLMTSVEHDGGLIGPDFSLAFINGILSDIILAGGISSLDDIRLLAVNRFEAIVIGKALYEDKFTLPEAILAGRICQ